MTHITVPFGYSKGTSCEGTFNHLLEEVAKHGIQLSDVKAYLIGGSHINNDARASVGDRNISKMKALLKLAGLKTSFEHLGTNKHRIVKMNIASGELTLKHNNKLIVVPLKT